MGKGERERERERNRERFWPLVKNLLGNNKLYSLLVEFFLTRLFSDDLACQLPKSMTD